MRTYEEPTLPQRLADVEEALAHVLEFIPTHDRCAKCRAALILATIVNDRINAELKEE